MKDLEAIDAAWALIPEVTLEQQYTGKWLVLGGESGREVQYVPSSVDDAFEWMRDNRRQCGGVFKFIGG